MAYNSGPGGLGFRIFHRAVLRLMFGLGLSGNRRLFRFVDGFGLDQSREKGKCQQSKH